MPTILSHNCKVGRQTMITEYDIKLFQKSEERFRNLKSLDKRRLWKIAEDAILLQRQVRDVQR